MAEWIECRWRLPDPRDIVLNGVPVPPRMRKRGKFCLLYSIVTLLSFSAAFAKLLWPLVGIVPEMNSSQPECTSVGCGFNSPNPYGYGCRFGAWSQLLYCASQLTWLSKIRKLHKYEIIKDCKTILIINWSSVIVHFVSSYNERHIWIFADSDDDVNAFLDLLDLSC